MMSFLTDIESSTEVLREKISIGSS